MAGKVAVMGLLERHGKDGVAGSHRRFSQQQAASPACRTFAQHVETGANVHTDALPSYNRP